VTKPKPDTITRLNVNFIGEDDQKLYAEFKKYLKKQRVSVSDSIRLYVEGVVKKGRE
jgi:hypothetical protein